ncbi:transposase domain-containing protein [Lacrimispora algidixylanolytica]|uniref:transposase domain-containing protein n=1 Tax=Lacrimispora algidixylanolytica TaxID=94868 RepID=UPI000E73D1EC|nr:transposase domain-containing protein [Lacrimispora algidixylanolytica]
MINTIARAGVREINYSITETAKANHLMPYGYFEYLLTEIPKHLEKKDSSFCKDLLLWSDKLLGNFGNHYKNMPLLGAVVFGV